MDSGHHPHPDSRRSRPGPWTLAQEEMLVPAVAALILHDEKTRAAGKLFSASVTESHLEALHQLTRHITSVDMHREPGEQLAGFIHEAFDLEAVAIFDSDVNKTYFSGYWFADPENTLRNICMFERSSVDMETGLVSEVLRIGSLPIGSLLLRGELERLVANSIANLIAATFDRYHSRASLGRVESARKTERLRTTVLDSLAHTYKSPLTAIRAAATGVIEIGNLTSAQAELMSVIEEQTELLNTLTMRLLKTARLDVHDISLHLEPVALAPLVEDAISAVQAQYAGVAIEVRIIPEEIVVPCDRTLFSALLTQYLDNAVKYSEWGTLITVEVMQKDDNLLTSVHNIGPVIGDLDCKRIFERYFRGADTAASTPGTGIGLSVARAAAQAHGGDVWVRSNVNDGTTFWASLPLRRVHASQ